MNAPSRARIRALAHEATNGELAWRVPDTADAIYALAEAGLAILGGEAWVVRPPYTFGMPVLRTGEPSVIAWDTGSQRAGEAWPDFVRRTADESIAAIADLDVEAIVVPDGS